MPYIYCIQCIKCGIYCNIKILIFLGYRLHITYIRYDVEKRKTNNNI